MNQNGGGPIESRCRFLIETGPELKKKNTVLPPGGGSSPGGENGEGFSGENLPLLCWTQELAMPLKKLN